METAITKPSAAGTQVSTPAAELTNLALAAIDPERAVESVQKAPSIGQGLANVCLGPLVDAYRSSTEIGKAGAVAQAALAVLAQVATDCCSAGLTVTVNDQGHAVAAMLRPVMQSAGIDTTRLTAFIASRASADRQAEPEADCTPETAGARS